MPQRAWSPKDERKYEHIKESARERGASEDRAQEIAARTVNKGRREEGRTPNRSTQGTGNPSRAISARFAPLPPSSAFIDASPALSPAPKL